MSELDNKRRKECIEQFVLHVGKIMITDSFRRVYVVDTGHHFISMIRNVSGTPKLLSTSD